MLVPTNCWEGLKFGGCGGLAPWNGGARFGTPIAPGCPPIGAGLANPGGAKLGASLGAPLFNGSDPIVKSIGFESLGLLGLLGLLVLGGLSPLKFCLTFFLPLISVCLMQTPSLLTCPFWWFDLSCFLLSPFMKMVSYPGVTVISLLSSLISSSLNSWKKWIMSLLGTSLISIQDGWIVFDSSSVTLLVLSPSILKNFLDSIMLKLKQSYFLVVYSTKGFVLTDLAANSFRNFSISFSLISFLTTEITTVLASLTLRKLPQTVLSLNLGLVVFNCSQA